MNKSYLNYFKYRNPFKFISNIFRSYKKSSDIKRNQSEPTVSQQTNEDFNANKPKSEINLCSGQNDKHIQQWNNSKFEDDMSQDSLKLTSSNSKLSGASSNISLKKTSCHIDLNIQEKLNHIPFEIKTIKKTTSSVKIPTKRAYPWQNFNLTNARKPRYEEIKEVSDMRDEIINLRKSILRRPEVKPLNDRESPAKEVKFNKMASMMIYPVHNSNVMRQARINLSTNVNSSEKPSEVVFKKKKLPTPHVNKSHNVKMCCPHNYRRNLKKLRKCLPMEQGNFWYLNNNTKKQKIF